jgi:hypothetical protein
MERLLAIASLLNHANCCFNVVQFIIIFDLKFGKLKSDSGGWFCLILDMGLELLF